MQLKFEFKFEKIITSEVECEDNSIRSYYNSFTYLFTGVNNKFGYKIAVPDALDAIKLD